MKKDHYNIYLKIGLNILHCRKECGLTQNQLAELTGYSRNHIQRVETANTIPTIALLFEVCRVLNIPISKLLP